MLACVEGGAVWACVVDEAEMSRAVQEGCRTGDARGWEGRAGGCKGVAWHGRLVQGGGRAGQVGAREEEKILGWHRR